MQYAVQLVSIYRVVRLFVFNENVMDLNIVSPHLCRNCFTLKSWSVVDFPYRKLVWYSPIIFSVKSWSRLLSMQVEISQTEQRKVMPRKFSHFNLSSFSQIGQMFSVFHSLVFFPIPYLVFATYFEQIRSYCLFDLFNRRRIGPLTVLHLHLLFPEISSPGIGYFLVFLTLLVYF